MKFQGSRIVYLFCAECDAVSPKFRVYFYTEDDAENWNGKVPDGWDCCDDGELIGGFDWIIGYCPSHSEERRDAEM